MRRASIRASSSPAHLPPFNVSKVRVALAQINPTVGDLAGNAKQIAEAAREAHAGGAALMIAPELALSGYPPEDLLLRPAFMDACERQLDALAASWRR